MNQVIKELYDIEAQAGELLEHAASSKQKLQENKKRQMEEISVGIAAELEGRMATLQAQLEEQAKEDMQELVACSQQQIERLNKEYTENLRSYAREIVRKMTEV